MASEREWEPSTREFWSGYGWTEPHGPSQEARFQTVRDEARILPRERVNGDEWARESFGRMPYGGMSRQAQGGCEWDQDFDLWFDRPEHMR